MRLALRLSLVICFVLSGAPILQAFAEATEHSPCTDGPDDDCPPYCPSCPCAHPARAPGVAATRATMSLPRPLAQPLIVLNDVIYESPSLRGIFHPPKA